MVLLAVVGVRGQGRTTLLGIETGVQTFITHYSDHGFIRGDNAPWIDIDPNSSQGMGTELYNSFAALKLERRSRDNTLGIATGVQFSEVSGYLRKNINPNYYYLLYNQTGTTTEYLRVMEINQRSGYLGIPIEVRYYPFGHGAVSTYFMVGGNLGYRLYTHSKTTFQDPAMDKYQSGVNEVIGAPGLWYTSFYGGVGWLFGKEGKTQLDIRELRSHT